MNYNQVTLVGKISGKVKIKQYADGNKSLTFKLNIERMTGKSDKFSIVCWNFLADTCARYLRRGLTVLVDGHLRSNGKIEIVADRIKFLK